MVDGWSLQPFVKQKNKEKKKESKKSFVFFPFLRIDG